MNLKNLKGLTLIVLMAFTLIPFATTGHTTVIEGIRFVDGWTEDTLNSMGKPGACTPWPACKDSGEDPTDPPAGNQVADWGYDRIGAAGARASASGMATVAVLDSGIDYTHADLAGVIVACFSAIKRADAPCDSRDVKDDGGHGTHVAGTIAALDNDQDTVGIAAGHVQLINGKVLGKRGGDWSDLGWAIMHATDLGADVITMSLGGDLSGATSIINDLQDAVDYATSRGVAVLSAAGNEGTCDGGVQHSWPAESSGVFTVGATGLYAADGSGWATTWTGAEDDVMPCFSNNMPNGVVDVSAPGVYTLSLKKGGGTVEMSGTSMATPAVAGAIALLMAGGMSAAQAQNTLRNGALDLGYDSSLQGAGLIIL
jgi:subtilisin family serine protease